MHIHTQRFHFDHSYAAHFLYVGVVVVAEAASAKCQTVADWFELVIWFCSVQMNVEHEAFIFTCFTPIEFIRCETEQTLEPALLIADQVINYSHCHSGCLVAGCFNPKHQDEMELQSACVDNLGMKFNILHVDCTFNMSYTTLSY